MKDDLAFTYEELTRRADLMYSFATRYLKYVNKPRDYLTEGGVSVTEVHILALLSDHPGLTVKEAASQRGITSGGMSQMVAKLEKKGYLERRKEGGNSKNVHLYVTASGQALSDAHKAYNRMRMMQNTTGPIMECTPAEKEIFFKVLAAFNEQYKE